MRRKSRLLPMMFGLAGGITLLSSLAYGAYVFVSAKTETKPVIDPNAQAVCYLNDPDNRYVSFKSALDDAHADGGGIVVAIPPSDACVYPNGGTYSNKNDLIAQLAPERVEYTLEENITVYSDTYLVLPYDSSSMEGISLSNIESSYIEQMKTPPYNHTDNPSTVKVGTSNYNFLTNAATDYAGLFQRTVLRVKPGIQIHNQGTIVVSGILSGGYGGSAYNGQTSHSYAEIILESDAENGASKIVQDVSSADLYCYGYISEEGGSGSLEVSSGRVFEPFILRDYRAIPSSYAVYRSGMNETYLCSPFNQFELRNISASLTLRDGGSLIGMANIYDVLQVPLPQRIDLNLIGNGEQYFLDFKDGAYLRAKYNPSTQVCDADFYGGFDLRSIVMSLSAMGQDVTLNTNLCLFPLSYRFDIGLNGNGAVYDCNNQNVKVMTGAKLEVGSGATLNVNRLVVYTAFADRAKPSTMVTQAGGTAYPSNKNGGEFRVAGAVNAQYLAGNLILENGGSYVVPEGSDRTAFTSYEFLSMDSSASGLVPYAVQAYTQLKEELNVIDASDLDELVPLFIGVQTFSNLPDYCPSYVLNVFDPVSAASRLDPIRGFIPSQVRAASGLPSGEYASSDGVQRTYLMSPGTRYQYRLLGDIYLVYENGSSWSSVYEFDSIRTIEKATNAYVISSNLSIEESDFPIAGFDVGSLSHPIPSDNPDEQIYPLFVGKTIQLTGSIANADKAYIKRLSWSTSDAKIARITPSSDTINVTVTGVAVGQATIMAKAGDFTDTFVVHVYQSIDDIGSGFVGLDESQCSISSDPSDRITSSSGGTANFTVHYNAGAWINTITWTVNGSGRWESTGTTSAYYDTSADCTFGAQSGMFSDVYTVTCTLVDYAGKSVKVTKEFKVGLIDKPDTCIVAGTLITLSDGSEIPVEDIQPGDELLVFNHETGKIDSAPAVFNDMDPLGYYDVIELTFDDGSTLGISYQHALFDVDANEYVYVDESSYQSLIGHRFYKEGGKVATLVDAKLENRLCVVGSPVSDWHLNFFTNGFLGMPGNITGFFNMFELDENMKYDEEAKARDIEEYGLFTYEDLSDYMVPDAFLHFPFAYTKVSIGKGLMSYDDLIGILEHYREYLFY